MFDPQPALGERLIGHVLLQRQLQEAQILYQPAPRGQGIRRRVGNALIVDTASVRCTQKENREEGIDQQDIFYRMVLFLAALTRRLFSRVLGADDAPFRPVMGTRGDAGAAAGTATNGCGGLLQRDDYG